MKSDVYLLLVYHTYFLFPHFKWLQLSDPEIGEKKAGYLNRHIAVRYFLMYKDITSASRDTSWKTLPAFRLLYESIRDLSPNVQEEQGKKVSLV